MNWVPWAGPWKLHRWMDSRPVLVRRYWRPEEGKHRSLGTVVGPPVS